jgi:hypothetical protein
MSLIPDVTEYQTRLAGLPILEYQPGESVLSAGSTTGKLFILKS